MYEALLFIHSWTRWAVVIGIVLILWQTLNGWLRNKKWTGYDNHLVWAFDQVLNYQVIFGLVLYLGLSPMTKMFFKNWGVIKDNPVFEFWAYFHISMMLLSIVIFQIGKFITYKKPIEQRHKGVAITMIFITLTIGLAIPWPFLVHGRALFRGF